MTIDHLSVDHVVHVIHAFADARGVEHDIAASSTSTTLRPFEWRSRRTIDD
jgi:hypothetical protein